MSEKVYNHRAATFFDVIIKARVSLAQGFRTFTSAFLLRRTLLVIMKLTLATALSFIASQCLATPYVLTPESLAGRIKTEE